MKNNLRKLQMELKLVKIEKDVDMENLSKGLAAAFLPVYHYVFLNYSRPLAELISNINIDMYGKSDLKFLESMYKVLRELFSYKPPITKEQFFSSGFIERKVIMCTEVLSMVREKHKSMMPKPAVRYAPKSRTNSPTQPPIRVASARPAAASDSPLSTKERVGKQDTRHREETKLQVDNHKMTNPVIRTAKLSEKRPTSATIVSSRVAHDVDTDTVPRVINELLHTHKSPPSGSQVNTHSVDMAGFAQSGTWAHTQYTSCPITTEQRRDNTRMHMAMTNYNPSSYVETSTGGGYGNYTAVLDNVERTMPASAWRTMDYGMASDIRNGEVSEVTTTGDCLVTVRDGHAGDIQAGYIQEGDPDHSRMSVASMAYYAPCQAAVEGSHSDKLLTQDMDTTPLRALAFPTTPCPTVQKTLTSIMQTQRDMNARIITLENSLASNNKDHGLERPTDDRSLGSAQFENILARLTLLENRMVDLDVKKVSNSEVHHSKKSAADDTFDSVRGSSKLRCSSGVMDMNSPGKDDLAEGDYSHLSDTAFSGDPTHRINELLKQTEEMLEKSQATAAFS